jgi:hypothetical protein
MDESEARAMADARLRDLRNLPWAELKERYLDRQKTDEVTAASGVVYQ